MPMVPPVIPGVFPPGFTAGAPPGAAPAPPPKGNKKGKKEKNGKGKGKGKGSPGGAALGSNSGPVIDNSDLQMRIRTQIEYYFSNENLFKDVFFRNQMDDEGWVGLQVIAQFNRVKTLLLYTNSPSVLFEALLVSKPLEVDIAGGRVRRKDGSSGPLPAAKDKEKEKEKEAESVEKKEDVDEK